MTETIKPHELRDSLLAKIKRGEQGSMSTGDIVRGTEEVPIGSPEWCALAIDKIEGLSTDLELAVEVAYKRGATVWTQLNYPEIYKRLRDAELAAGSQD